MSCCQGGGGGGAGLSWICCACTAPREDVQITPPPPHDPVDPPLPLLDTRPGGVVVPPWGQKKALQPDGALTRSEGQLPSLSPHFPLIPL